MLFLTHDYARRAEYFVYFKVFATQNDGQFAGKTRAGIYSAFP